MQKTFTLDCFSHRSVKNKGQRTQYFQAGTHPAIIPPQDWEFVQGQLLNRRGSSTHKSVPIEQKFYITRIKSGNKKAPKGVIYSRIHLQTFRFTIKVATNRACE